MLLVDWGITFSHASTSQEEDTSSIMSLVYPKEIAGTKEKLAPKVVTIKTAEGSTSHLVYSTKVEDVLKEADMQISYHDIVLPEDLEVVVDGTVLQIVKVDIELMVKAETVPFETVQVESNNVAYGQIEVAQEGVLGVAEKTIRVIYEDGKAKKSEVVETKLIKTPVQKIINVGVAAVGIQDCAHWDSVIDEYAPLSKDPTKNKWMKYIMRAETWCNSGKVTRNTYFGLFQFLKSTFLSNGGNLAKIFDGQEQIKIVSRMYDRCQQWQWGPHEKTNSSGSIVSFKEKHPDHYQIIKQKCGR